MGEDRRRAQLEIDAVLAEEREKERRKAEAAAWPGKKSLVASLDGSAGAALPTQLQQSLEQSLGEDLGGVRVHVDGNAARAAAALQAKAFTIGQAVYFGAGHFDPASKRGRQLIAHEVAHTVQQRGAARASDVAVARPSDAFESQAETFANAFIARGAVPHIARGSIARAVIQRDLLDGAAPAAQPEPIHTGAAPDLIAQTRAALHETRGKGGRNAVVQLARNLRAQATPQTTAAIESAIQAECNALEKQDLGTGPAAPHASTGAPPRAGGGPAPAVPSTVPTGNEPGITPRPALIAAPPPEGPTIGPAPNADHAPPRQDGHTPTGATPQPGAPGPAAAPQHGATAQGPAANGAAQHGPTAPGAAHEAPAAHGPAPAAEHVAEHSPAVPDANGRALIEQELAFHEQWAVYAERGAGGRAEHLLAGMVRGEDGGLVSGDLAMGGRGALLQFGGSMATKLLVAKTPLSRIPGAGNIIGGALSAYSLFSNGGAGIRSLGTEISHGIGGAFDAANWRDSPWLTAANLVAGIKAVLELVGNVCSILSGLAYAFAAIAAVGGLLSVLFPPLAFLVPFIPAAVNFGRACGGIATICITAANILSPIPPILRAIHLIFSNNDPIQLVGDEHKYHEEVQGALAAYGSAKLGQVAEHGAAGVRRSVTSDRVAAMGEGASAYRGALGGGLLPTTTNVRAGVANTREALGMTDQTRSGQQAGRGYFDPESQTATNERRLEKERKHLATEEKDNENVQRHADRAVARRDADPTAQNVKLANNAAATAERHEEQVAHQEHRVEMVEQQTQIPTGRQGEELGGETGDMTDNAFKRNRETANESDEDRKREQANEAFHELREGQQPVHAEHDAQGHVALPPAPGTLQQIDALDRQIQQLQQSRQQVSAQTVDAHETEHDAGVQATGLAAAQKGVTAHADQNARRSEASQQRIDAQNTDMAQRTSDAHGNTSGPLGQAAGPLTGIAANARMVDGLLQRIPANRFIDVPPAQRNVHQFVLGIDQVTGAGPKQETQHQKTTTTIAARKAQKADAARENAFATAQAHRLAQQMEQDARIAQAARDQAREVAAQGRAEQQRLAQQLETTEQQRRTQWTQLLAWAAQHRALREQASASGHHE